jgi:hypothetical protein
MRDVFKRVFKRPANSLIVLLALAALLVPSAPASAEAFHIGLRVGPVVSFPGQTRLLLGVQGEWRELLGEFGLRLDVGLNAGMALFAVYRPVPDAFGPLYLGLGLGYAFDPVNTALDMRLLVGYEWLLLPELRVLIEANARFPLNGGAARLELGVGLNLQLSGPLPQLVPPGNTPANPPGSPPRQPPSG